MRRVVIALLGLLLGVTSSLVGLDARQPSPLPVIHRVTLLPADGVLVIEGTGLGDHLLVTVDGQAVTTLPGTTATRMDAQAPATVLTTPGTYRLTVADPVRHAWDGFIVASAPEVGAGVVAAAPGSGAGRDEGDGRSHAATALQPTRGGPSYAPQPLTVIEDAGSPFRTALGASALAANTTGVENTGLGYHALDSNTSGDHNTAVGSRALEASNGADNTAIGRLALGANTTGTSNTAVGHVAMRLNTAGFQNTALGRQALFNNVTGDYNVAIGVDALLDTTGDRNTGLGQAAGSNATSGDYNIFIGAGVMGSAGDANTIRIGLPFSSGVGQSATFIAGISGTSLPGGQLVVIDGSHQLGTAAVAPLNSVNSTSVINDSLTALDLASGAVGTSELADDTVTAAKVAFNYAGSTTEGGAATDVACAGCVSATDVGFTFATLGANTFGGTQAIGAGNLDLAPSIATEGNVTKNGVRFLHNAGARNTFLGAAAGNFALTGTDNSASGNGALSLLTSGVANTAHGAQALVRNTSGSENVAVGFNALGLATTGSRNTALGTNAGASLPAGSDNIYVGADVTGAAADANTMRLGLPYDSGTGVGQSQTFIAGIWGNLVTGTAAQVFVDANGKLGTGTPVAILTGTATLVTPAAVEQHLQAQQATIAALQAANVELQAALTAVRARLARLEAGAPRRR